MIKGIVISCLFFLMIFLFASCKGNEQKTNEIDTLPATPKAVGGGGIAAPFGGNLDTLSIEASKFLAIHPDKKLV